MIRPQNGLAIVHRLNTESAERLYSSLVGFLALKGVVRSAGYFIGRILALPDDPPFGVEVGDKVLVEANSSPDGAPLLPPGLFGLGEEEQVAFVRCRRLPTPERSEELAYRLKLIREFIKKYPEDAYPQHHPFWESDEGKAELTQMGEHRFHIERIKDARKGKGHDRLFKKGDSDFTLPDGILAVLED